MKVKVNVLYMELWFAQSQVEPQQWRSHAGWRFAVQECVIKQAWHSMVINYHGQHLPIAKTGNGRVSRVSCQFAGSQSAELGFHGHSFGRGLILGRMEPSKVLPKKRPELTVPTLKKLSLACQTLESKVGTARYSDWRNSLKVVVDWQRWWQTVFQRPERHSTNFRA